MKELQKNRETVTPLKDYLLKLIFKGSIIFWSWFNADPQSFEHRHAVFGAAWRR